MIRRIIGNGFVLGILMVLIQAAIHALVGTTGIFGILLPLPLAFAMGLLYSYLRKKLMSEIERLKVVAVIFLSLLGGLIQALPTITADLSQGLVASLILFGFLFSGATTYFFLWLGSTLYMRGLHK